MHRRSFLAAAASVPLVASSGRLWADEEICKTYASPAEAMKAPREQVAFVTATYAGTKTKKPDYLAVVDVDPASKNCGQVIARVEFPSVGDELHHFGWNACGSCHGTRASPSCTK